MSQHGLVIVAVNVDQQTSDAYEFMKRYPASFRVVFDPKGQIAEQYKVNGMPSTFLFDRRGRVRFQHIGFRSGDKAKYSQELEQLLGEQ